MSFFLITFCTSPKMPVSKLTEAPLLVGLDGQQKMSKTLDNHLELAAAPEEGAPSLESASGRNSCN